MKLSLGLLLMVYPLVGSAVSTETDKTEPSSAPASPLDEWLQAHLDSQHAKESLLGTGESDDIVTFGSWRDDGKKLATVVKLSDEDGTDTLEDVAEAFLRTTKEWETASKFQKTKLPKIFVGEHRAALERYQKEAKTEDQKIRARLKRTIFEAVLGKPIFESGVFYIAPFANFTADEKNTCKELWASVFVPFNASNDGLSAKGFGRTKILAVNDGEKTYYHYHVTLPDLSETAKVALDADRAALFVRWEGTALKQLHCRGTTFGIEGYWSIKQPKFVVRDKATHKVMWLSK